MKTIKKVFLSITIFVIALLFVGCTTNGNNKIINTLTIITINDFHGALEESSGKYGMAKLAASINAEISDADASLIISAGDMYQGTALSSYNHGKTVTDIMNYMKFDAMALGNHEFDWGLSEVTRFRDGKKSNGEADFPLLGCNIIEKPTGKVPAPVESYTIVKRGNLKIGIIGYMGQGNEADILSTMVKDYEFVDPLPIIKNITKDLRENQGVDIIIVVGHEGNTSNQRFASLTGVYKIDAIINAHTHSTYSGKIKNIDGVDIPYVQAGNNGQKFGVIKLAIDQETKRVSSSIVDVKTNAASVGDTKVASIINKLKKETDPVFGVVIGKANEEIGRYACADWIATTMKEYGNVDIGVVNIGGVRAAAFPIAKNSDIKISTIHTISPFDNCLCKVDLIGSDVATIARTSDLVLSTNVYVDRSTDTIYVNGEVLDLEKVYSVMTIDYLFNKDNLPFLHGNNIEQYNTVARDILIEKIKKDGTIIVPTRGNYE